MFRNPFGGNAFNGGLVGPFPGPLPQQGFGQFGNVGGYFNGGVPYQGGNMFPAGGVVLPPRSYSPGPMNGQFGPGFDGPIAPGNPFMNQPIQFPSGIQQPPFVEPNQFGSGTFGRPRSRPGSRHRSKSRRRRSRSSSSSDDERNPRGSPFAGPGIPYQNMQQFPNFVPLSPRAGSPVIPPRVPLW